MSNDPLPLTAAERAVTARAMQAIPDHRAWSHDAVVMVVARYEATVAALEAERDQLDEQIKRLASFILREIPGEPSQSQGAVDTAIRLLGRATHLAALEAAVRAWAEAQWWTQADVPGCHNRLQRKCDTTDALLAAVAALSGDG